MKISHAQTYEIRLLVLNMQSICA